MEAIELLSMILPEGILEYFNVKKASKSSNIFEVWLEEKPALNNEINGINVISKGFHKEIIIKDFPLRSRAVHLHIQRRRWIDKVTGERVERQWDLVQEGTRMTKEFASFLKALHG